MNISNQTTTDPKKICLDLLKAESEDEVTSVLEREGLLRDELWKDLGDDENNFSIIGNQQNTATAALVEKIINSIDAILISKCKMAGIDPESPDAPQNMNEAAEKFLGVRKGRLINLKPNERSSLAEKSIWLIATGLPEKPCYSFVDFGEGQSPKQMPKTFLSIFRKSGKIRIPFVQGRFQMGGTGVLPYCGNKKYQLIVSRRAPDLARMEKDDDTVTNWGFTIVRRVPREGVRSSVYRYLAPDGRVLSFFSDTMPFLPTNDEKTVPFSKSVEWGTCIKLYDYQFDVAALKTNLKLDLSRELDRHLVSLPIPVRLCECRDYIQESPYQTLSGLDVRLKENESVVLEDQFPNSALLQIPELGGIVFQIFLFKKGAGKRFISKKTGIMFTINGQTHGSFTSGFFLRRTIQLDYLKDDLLVIGDCTNLPGLSRDDLFMSSRDRLRETLAKKTLEEELELLLRNHAGLQYANKQRELDASRDSWEDNKLLEKIIDKMLSFTPSLANFFSIGERLTSPELNGAQDLSFEGKKYPTYFKILREPDGGLVKECAVNAKCAVTYETDVENQYFARMDDPGQLTVNPSEAKLGMLFWNGRGILFTKVPEGTEPGSTLQVIVEVRDSENQTPFTSKFDLKAMHYVEKSKIHREKAKEKKSRQLDLPNIKKVTKDEWTTYGFDNCSGLKIIGSTIFVNIDNVYLVTEKSRSKTHAIILEEQFLNGLVIASLAMRHDLNDRVKKNQIVLDESEIRERIEEASRGLSAVILPIIQQLDAIKIKRDHLFPSEE